MSKNSQRLFCLGSACLGLAFGETWLQSIGIFCGLNLVMFAYVLGVSK